MILEKDLFKAQQALSFHKGWAGPSDFHSMFNYGVECQTLQAWSVSPCG